jgi:hypothetical protein
MNRYLLGLLVALASLSASADWVFAEGALAVIARKDTPCSPRLLEIVKLAEPPAGLQWRKAEVVYEGQKLDACWAAYQGQALIVDETGEGGAIPQRLFRVLKDI